MEGEDPYESLDNESRFYAASHDHMMKIFWDGKYEEAFGLAEQLLLVSIYSTVNSCLWLMCNAFAEGLSTVPYPCPMPHASISPYQQYLFGGAR